MIFKTTVENESYYTYAYLDDVKVCECKIDIKKRTGTWTISSWYTTEGYKHRGYGTLTLQECLSKIHAACGTPEKVEYIWNGANEYVLEWLNEHFGAVSKCPIAVQKYASDDDWESHIYILNAQKFIEHFHLDRPEESN